MADNYDMLITDELSMIGDGHGNWWERCKPAATCNLQVVRPGKVQCDDGPCMKVGRRDG